MTSKSQVQIARETANTGKKKSLIEKKNESLEKDKQTLIEDEILSKQIQNEKEINTIKVEKTQHHKEKKSKITNNLLMPYDTNNKYMTFKRETHGYYIYEAYDQKLKDISFEITKEIKKVNPKAKNVTKGQILEDILENYFKNLTQE
jgi:hypothetical protein